MVKSDLISEAVSLVKGLIMKVAMTLLVIIVICLFSQSDLTCVSTCLEQQASGDHS